MSVPAQPETRTISAAEFKAKCLQLMDEVNESKLTLVVTKRGKPVAQLIAAAEDPKPFRSIVGRTPGIKIPSDAEWVKLKAQWASEWADPFEKMARKSQKVKNKKSVKV